MLNYLVLLVFFLKQNWEIPIELNTNCKKRPLWRNFSFVWSPKKMHGKEESRPWWISNRERIRQNMSNLLSFTPNVRPDTDFIASALFGAWWVQVSIDQHNIETYALHLIMRINPFGMNILIIFLKILQFKKGSWISRFNSPFRAAPAGIKALSN